MKIIYRLICLVSLVGINSCGGFAGPYGYSEEVSSNCLRDTIIQRFTHIKATGRYNHIHSFPDGPDTYPSNYIFYFYSQPYNSILSTVVTPGFDKKSAVRLVAVKEAKPESKWKEFNHDLDSEQQKNMTNWFNREILPNLTCK